MQNSGQTTGEYPLYGYIVVDGRYREGLCNNPQDTAKFLSQGGGMLPADIQMRSCARLHSPRF